MGLTSFCKKTVTILYKNLPVMIITIKCLESEFANDVEMCETIGAIAVMSNTLL